LTRKHSAKGILEKTETQTVAETETKGEITMKTGELIIFGILAAMVVFVLISCPFEDLASFNPIEWLADSINGSL
jgi:hypothetical protein